MRYFSLVLGATFLVAAVSTAAGQGQSFPPPSAAPAAAPPGLAGLPGEAVRPASVTPKSPLAQKLERPFTVEFEETPLGDVLHFLSEQLDVKFHVNRKSLEEQAIAVDTPVTIQLKELQASTVLKLLLDDLELGYALRDGYILIATKDYLDRQLEVRIYNCRDLLGRAGVVPPPSGGGGGFGGFGAVERPGGGGGLGGGGMGMPMVGSPQASQLMALVQTAVESDAWDALGGSGSIAEFNGMLVVKQSARVHEKVDELLTMLREAAQQ